MIDNPAVPEKGGAEARRSLHALSSVINTLDFNLSRPDATLRDQAMRQRIVYLRNTLLVSLELWQDDLDRRVNRSREKFYVFCMTESEKISFIRRLSPGLGFAVEELRNINNPAFRHLAAVLVCCSADGTRYARENKACVKRAIEDKTPYPRLSHATLTHWPDYAAA